MKKWKVWGTVLESLEKLFSQISTTIFKHF
jgi:hypothetical protein